MNWNSIINYVLTFASGLVVAAFGYKGIQKQSNSSNEGVYAHSMPEIIAKVQELLEQLESKNGKIAELTAQVEAQSATIDILTKQIGEMQRKLDLLSGGHTIEKSQTELQ